MKRLLLLIAILLTACGPSQEEKKKEVDDLFSFVKALPISKPCKNLNGYIELEKLEKTNKTSYYAEITPPKITYYRERCAKSRANSIRDEFGRIKQLDKLPDGEKNMYLYVQDFPIDEFYYVELDKYPDTERWSDHLTFRNTHKMTEISCNYATEPMCKTYREYEGYNFASYLIFVDDRYRRWLSKEDLSLKDKNQASTKIYREKALAIVDKRTFYKLIEEAEIRSRRKGRELDIKRKLEKEEQLRKNKF